jgi:23S rRNA-/tRNA-specific pseudouridylate synthase
MGYRIGDVVWLRRDSGLVDLRGRVGTNLGKVGDVWSDAEGERISVVYEDEQVLAVDLPPSDFVIEQFAGALRF